MNGVFKNTQVICNLRVGIHAICGSMVLLMLIKGETGLVAF